MLGKQTYDVLDCIVYNVGTQSNYKDMRDYHGNNGIFERLSDYTKITDTNNTTGGVIYVIKQNNSTNLQLPQM